jgi:hypothetical protein
MKLESVSLRRVATIFMEVVKGQLPWVSVCPECDGYADVYVHDKGMKFARRLLVLNNRFACAHCNITWRRRSPFHTLRLHTKKSPGSDDKTSAGEG